MTRTALIIDDEINAIEYLESLIREVAPDLEVTGSASHSDEALNLCYKFRPDLVFLDIHMQTKSGLEIAEELYQSGLRPYIIFVTAFEKHAIDAFRQHALDYLLKPVERADLIRAITRFFDQSSKDKYFEQVTSLLEAKQKIRFNTREGFVLINPEEIIYCEASQNYSYIVLGNSTQTLISLNLGSVHRKLPRTMFWRISKSHLINISYLVKVDRLKRSCLLKKGDKDWTLKLSLSRIKEFPSES